MNNTTDKVIQHFNIFDIFSMLIPGLIVTTTLGIVGKDIFLPIWHDYGADKYFVYIILSYFIGLLLNELGQVIDDILLSKLFYGDIPRYIFTESKKILKNPINLLLAKQVKEDILSYVSDEEQCAYDSSSRNSFVYSYCINELEANNLTGKADKMMVLSEMSRSIVVGFVGIIGFMIYLRCFNIIPYNKIWEREILILILLVFVFSERKVRYERYRYSILVRTYAIFHRNEKK